MVYMTPFFARDLMEVDLVKHPLWIAYWPSSPDVSPSDLGPWGGTWTVLQYSTSDTSLSGIERPPVDSNVFNGDVNDLKKFADAIDLV